MQFIHNTKNILEIIIRNGNWRRPYFASWANRTWNISAHRHKLHLAWPIIFTLFPRVGWRPIGRCPSVQSNHIHSSRINDPQWMCHEQNPTPGWTLASFPFPSPRFLWSDVARAVGGESDSAGSVGRIGGVCTGLLSVRSRRCALLRRC
jgi:hypothetical protein